MTDIRAGDKYQLDESRLPWLELDVEEQSRSPLLRILGWVVLGVLVLGFGFAGGYWVRTGLNAPAGSQSPVAGIAANRGGSSGSPTMTAEPAATPAPPTPTSMLSPSHAASRQAVARKKASRTMRRRRAVPESGPVTPTALDQILVAQNAPVPPAPTFTVARTVPASTRASAPRMRYQSIQLGAFSSPAAADGVWNSLRWRFGYLRSLTANITAVSVNGRRMYRLRASGPNAELMCKWVRQARESCVAVRPRGVAMSDGRRLATGIGVGNRAGYL